MRANLHTPWSDVAELVQLTSTKDAQGFETETETLVPVMCSWGDGVSQSEFYRSRKAGMDASAQVEVQKADLYAVWPLGTPGERFVYFMGLKYKVLRDFPQTFDTQTLILSEVIR